MTRTRNLEVGRLDSQQWHKRIVDTTFLTDSGEEKRFVGEALVSEEDSAYGQVLELHADTDVMGTVTVDVPVIVSRDVSCRLSVNGKPSLPLTLSAPAGGRRLQRIGADITDWSADRPTCVVRLLFSYEGHEGSITVLTDPEDAACRPRLIQEYSPRVTGPALLFLMFGWGTVLAAALWMIANIGSLSDTFRVYAVLVTTAGWLATAAGMPSLKRLPIGPVIRKLYAGSRRHRPASLILLCAIFLGASAAASTVLYGLVTRYRYTQLVLRALTESPDPRVKTLARAFALLPWRHEAPIAFERLVFEMRARSNQSAFRSYVRRFTNDEGVKTAVQRAANHGVPLSILNPDAAVLIDADLWYWEVVPEASESGSNELLERAIRELEAHRPDDMQMRAHMLAQSLRLQLLASDSKPEARRSARRALIEFANDHEPELGTTHEYQVAQDTIAASLIADCQFDDASRWYRRLLETRRTSSQDAGAPLWLRPPHKLLLYHLFMASSGVTVSDDDAAGRLARRLCNGQMYGTAFNDEVLQLPQNGAFKEPATWLKRTIFEVPLEPFVAESLKTGWRY